MAIALPDVMEPEAPPEATAVDEGVRTSEWGTPEHSLGRIVVPYDGSALSRAALGPAAILGQAGSGASVTLVHAVEPAHVPDVAESIALSLGETDARVMLAEAARRLSAAGVTTAELLVLPRPGDPPSASAAIL